MNLLRHGCPHLERETRKSRRPDLNWLQEVEGALFDPVVDWSASAVWDVGRFMSTLPMHRDAPEIHGQERWDNRSVLEEDSAHENRR